MLRSTALALTLALAALACGGAAPDAPPTVPTSSVTVAPPVPPPSSSAVPVTEPPPPATAADAGAPATQKLPTSAGAVRYRGGDGSSEAQAVVIEGARGEQDGVASEYAWLDQVYGSRLHGGYRVLKQALRGSGGKHFDVLSVETKDGKRAEVWFDISGYFGQF